MDKKYLNNCLAAIFILASSSAYAQLTWRFPDCNDLEIMKIEFRDEMHDTLFVTVSNNCDTCYQHVYTGLIAYKNSDTVAVDESLMSRPSPPNNGTSDYYLIKKKDFEIDDNIRIQMAFGICDSIPFSSLLNVNPTIVVDKYILFNSYPNPFNPVTTITYQIPKTEFITLKIFDVLGREVAILVNEEKAAGNYSVNFNATNLSSGVYIYSIRAGSFYQTKKMILTK